MAPTAIQIAAALADWKRAEAELARLTIAALLDFPEAVDLVKWRASRTPPITHQLAELLCGPRPTN